MNDQRTADVLSQAHREYLAAHAISDEIIARTGIFSAGEQVIFPWKDGDLETPQARVWPEPEEGLPEGAPKYRWPPGEPLHLWAIRPVEDAGPDAPVIIAEGTKQSLAVASNAPDEYAVYGMAGCWGWSNTDLSRFAGHRVYIMLDADATGNLNVYEAGERLAAQLELEDAVPGFVPSPAWGKDGIDDHLAGLKPERRTERLVKLIARGQSKPADRRPAADMRKLPDPGPDTGGRGQAVIVNKDRLEVIREILWRMKERFDGRQLFCFGDVLTRLRVDEDPSGHVLSARAEPLDKDSFIRWMAEAVATYRKREATQTAPVSYEAAWPEQQTIGALLASGDEFARMSRLSRAPFVRKDGTICFKHGYDADTQAVLIMGNSGMDSLDIPDQPGQDDAIAAASRLLDTWLHDMPWRDDASRANALALVLTPFIRGLVPLVPMAVISGLQPGVGKNLLADCISLVTTGEVQAPLPWLPDDDDENRKQITSAFRAGSQLFVFDEAHQIGGNSLTRAITSVTYADRILGVTKMASFPNQVTWIALGNQVTVNADMARRTYFIDLWPTVPDPESRPESDFLIPDLRGYTAGNRAALVSDALTVIRAWYAAGQPQCPRGSLMGSFEAWDKMMSGILGYAGVDGFLGKLAERRSEQDATGGYWAEHLAWLRASFGGREFTCLDVRARAMASGGSWDAPPRMDDLNRDGWTRDLGQAYGRHADRWFRTSAGMQLRIHKAGIGHGTKVRWSIQELGPGEIHPIHPIHPEPADQGPAGNREQDTLADQAGMDRMDHPVSDSRENPDRSEPEGVDGLDVLDGSLPPELSTRARARTHTHTRGGDGWGDQSNPSDPSRGLVVRADLETAEASRLYLEPRGEFIRLAGIIGPNGEPQIASVADVAAMLDIADRVDGHNFAGFDGPALAWHHPELVRWDELAPKIRDTELIARQVKPPRSREAGHSADRYGLDVVASELGVAGKTDDLGRLARRYGGYGKIPQDNQEYIDYLCGDLRATAAVSDALMPYYDSDPYLPREHLLAQLAGQMSLNGFRVDTELLAGRKAGVEQAKADAVRALHDGWDLPLGKTVTRGRGEGKHEEFEEFLSPLASDPGKAWLAAQFERYQVPDPPRTPKSRDLATGADVLRPIMNDEHCPAGLREMLGLMETVTTARTVYQTAAECLAPDGRVHPFVSFRQASGRWSVTNPGLTVFGKRGGKHVERDIFIADEGHVILSCDLSQVDMRAMAGHSQDRGYMAMFDPGKDAHAEIGAQVGLSRQDAKAIGHGWNYGLGPARMIRNGLDPEKVYGFVNGMEARFPALIAWREVIREMGKAGQVLDNGFGRRMMADPARAYTVAPALMGQGGARDIMCESLLRLPRELWPFLRVMVHDEIVLSVPAWAAEEIGHIISGAMTWVWRDVPILCDLSKPGRSWGSVSDK
jgi:hypothetical protein